MARRKSTETVEKTSAAPEVPSWMQGLEVHQADPIERQTSSRTPKPTYTDDLVTASLENGPLQVVLPNQDAAREFTNDLLRATYKDPNRGVSKRVVPQGDGSVIVHFQVTLEKKARKYKNADILAWAEENGYGTLETGPVPSEWRQAYRVAMGYEKPAE